jgi:hypothetical protein
MKWGWTFNADLLVSSTRFRLTLPVLRPMFITRIKYTDSSIILEGEMLKSPVSIDGRTTKEEEREKAKDKADSRLY